MLFVLKKYKIKVKGRNCTMETKCFKALAILLSFVLIINFCAYAISGWYQVGDQMTYVNNEGYMIANAWKESDGMKFYLDDNGYVLYNKVFAYGPDIYYVGENGAKVTNRFVNVTSDMILNECVTPGTFYFSANGSAYKRNNATFTKLVDGKKYAFDDSGHLLYDCWVNEDGEVIDEVSDILNSGLYFIKSDGTMLQNSWYNFSNDVGATTELERSNMIAEDYAEMNGLWMYFGNDGKKYMSKDSSLKKLTLNGNSYLFDEKGILVEGFRKNINEVDRSQASNPLLTERIRYYDKISGELVKNKWIYDTTPESFDETDYNSGKLSWFYVDGEGAIVKNKIRTVDGKKYTFDGLGRLRTGFLLIDQISFFVAEYKAEDLSKDDFLLSVAEGGHLYGSDLSDLHYFEEGEINQGEMQTGELKIELADGVYEFNFKADGKAVGNKNELKRLKNSYYKNGLKLRPWEDTKYGIIKVKDDEYRVVNSQGNLITSRRRLIKDDYDNYIVVLNGRLAAYILEPIRKSRLKWKTINGITGYYYYDMDGERSRYTDLAVESGTTCPTPAMIANIPIDLKVNFR